MPTLKIEWQWEEAFDKFGFDDGGGIVMTHAVADFLRSLGYRVTTLVWGIHNEIIETIEGKDGVLMNADDPGFGADVGYDSPHAYLPGHLIAALDKEFSPDWEETL